MALQVAPLGQSSYINLGGYIPAQQRRPSVWEQALASFVGGAAGAAGGQVVGGIFEPDMTARAAKEGLVDPDKRGGVKKFFGIGDISPEEYRALSESAGRSKERASLEKYRTEQTGLERQRTEAGISEGQKRIALAERGEERMSAEDQRQAEEAYVADLRERQRYGEGAPLRKAAERQTLAQAELAESGAAENRAQAVERAESVRGQRVATNRQYLSRLSQQVLPEKDQAAERVKLERYLDKATNSEMSPEEFEAASNAALNEYLTKAPTGKKQDWKASPVGRAIQATPERLPGAMGRTMLENIPGPGGIPLGPRPAGPAAMVTPTPAPMTGEEAMNQAFEDWLARRQPQFRPARP